MTCTNTGHWPPTIDEELNCCRFPNPERQLSGHSVGDLSHRLFIFAWTQCPVNQQNRRHPLLFPGSCQVQSIHSMWGIDQTWNVVVHAHVGEGSGIAVEKVIVQAFGRVSFLCYIRLFFSLFWSVLPALSSSYPTFSYTQIIGIVHQNFEEQ